MFAEKPGKKAREKIGSPWECRNRPIHRPEGGDQKRMSFIAAGNAERLRRKVEEFYFG
jgi:hypothetical protein